MIKAPLIPCCISCYQPPKRLWIPAWSSHAYSCSNETCANQINKNWLIEKQWQQINTYGGIALKCKTCDFSPEFKHLPKEDIYLYSCSNTQCPDSHSRIEIPLEIWQGMNIIALPCKHCGGVPERKWSLTLKCAVHRCSQERCTSRVVSSLYPHDAWYTLDLWTRQNLPKSIEDGAELPTDAPVHNEKLHKLEDTKRACADCSTCSLQNMCDTRSTKDVGYTSYTSAGDISPQPSELADLVQAYGGFDQDLQDCCMSIIEFCWDIPQEAVRFINRVMELPVESRRSVVDAIQKRRDLTSDMEDLLEVYSKEELVEALKSL